MSCTQNKRELGSADKSDQRQGFRFKELDSKCQAIAQGRGLLQIIEFPLIQRRLTICQGF